MVEAMEENVHGPVNKNAGVVLTDVDDERKDQDVVQGAEDSAEEGGFDFYGEEAGIDEDERKRRSDQARRNKELFLALNSAPDQDSFVEKLAEIFDYNQGLVIKAAEHIWSKSDWLSFDDLVIEGNVGLLDAIVKYKPDKGAFSTFARPKIWGAIERAVENDPRRVRADAGTGKDLRFLLKSYKRLRGGDPDDKSLVAFAKEYKIYKSGSGAEWDEEGLELARKSLKQVEFGRSIEATETDDEDVSEVEVSNGEVEGDAFQEASIAGDECEDDGCEGDRLQRIKDAINEAAEEGQLNPYMGELMVAYVDSLAAACKSPDEKKEFAKDERVASFTEPWIYHMLLEGLRSEGLRGKLAEKGILV